MKYTNDQIQNIKDSFSKKDVKILTAYFVKKGFNASLARQYTNGLKPSISSSRAREIAEVIGKPKVIKALLPWLYAPLPAK